MLMDIVELLLWSVALFLGSLIGTIAYSYIADFSLRKRLEGLETALFSNNQRERGEIGLLARREKTERTQAALAKAVMLFKEGKPPADVIKEVASEYPDVAVALAAKHGLKI